MTWITILWALLSAIPGAGFMVAGKSLWDVRYQPGSLFPLIFCLANGLYDVVFGVILLVGVARPAGANNLDLVILWALLYLPARVTSACLALFLSGQVDEGWLRKWLKL